MSKTVNSRKLGMWQVSFLPFSPLSFPLLDSLQCLALSSGFCRLRISYLSHCCVSSALLALTGGPGGKGESVGSQGGSGGPGESSPPT